MLTYKNRHWPGFAYRGAQPVAGTTFREAFREASRQARCAGFHAHAGSRGCCAPCSYKRTCCMRLNKRTTNTLQNDASECPQTKLLNDSNEGPQKHFWSKTSKTTQRSRNDTRKAKGNDQRSRMTTGGNEKQEGGRQLGGSAALRARAGSRGYFTPCSYKRTCCVCSSRRTMNKFL